MVRRAPTVNEVDPDAVTHPGYFLGFIDSLCKTSGASESGGHILAVTALAHTI
jgi:hypothetical protein